MIQNPMLQIREGMTVYDRTGAAIGTVSFVRFGDEDPSRPGIETVTGSRVDKYGSSLVEEIAQVFAGNNNLPQPLREQFIRYGFVRINAGLLSLDRFVMPDQVASVDGDGVRLRVTDDELIKA